MKLELHCHACKGKFKIKEKASSRSDLILLLGEYFSKKCSNCGSQAEFHVNDVKAQTAGLNALGLLGGLMVMVLVWVFFWEHGYISTIGFFVGGLIIAGTNGQSLTSNHHAFNKYRIQSTPRDDWKREG